MADGLPIPELTKLPDLVKKYIIPLFEATGELWKAGKQLYQGNANQGTYEVLDYDIKLELKDPEGEKAVVSKREKVKYLQNNVIAFQDQAWGDGKILINYRCAPGLPVDQYRFGQKTYILISLRGVRNRGDIDEFNINWGINNGFTAPTGFWATEINHNTQQVKVQVTFPKQRHPDRATIVEKNRQITTVLGNDRFSRLADGKWQITWEKSKPKLYEQYILGWEW